MIESPSDLLPLPSRRSRRRRVVGGRIASTDRTRIALADALGVLPVRLGSEGRFEPGALVVVEGILGPEGLTEATVVEHLPLPLPAPDGEFARLAWGRIGANLVARSRAFATVRAYFATERFVEVDTPLRVRTPGLDANVNALRAHRGWLVTSPEFHMKRLVVGGLPRVYQICHCSRADEQGAWHQPEFVMVEWYRAFAGVDAIVGDTERLVSELVRELAGTTRVTSPHGARLEVSPPFERITVRRAFARFAGVRDAVELAARDVDEYFRVLVEKVEPALAERRRPVFLTDYPLTEAALARPRPEDPTVAERFELYAGGVELCNGYGELTDPVEQRRRFVVERERRRAARQPVYPLDQRFLRALREGLPPSGGNALGLDRVVALALGTGDIAAVQAFPADRR
jgi:lysyl-tRNA synthetase class 2